MMARMLLLLLLNVFIFGFTKAHNAVDSTFTLAPVFSDHMVLQRNKPIKIFGKAASGSHVHVQFLNKALAVKADTYQMNVIAEGPVPEKALLKNGEIRIQFSNGTKGLSKQKSLLTKNSAPLTGFELLTEKGNRLSANARISGNEVVISVPAGERIKTVLYAYQPFTRANLYNEAGLPAPTFSIAVK